MRLLRPISLPVSDDGLNCQKCPVPNCSAYAEGQINKTTCAREVMGKVLKANRNVYEIKLRAVVEFDSSKTDWHFMVNDNHAHFPPQGTEEKCTRLLCLRNYGIKSLDSMASAIMGNLLRIPLVLILSGAGNVLKVVAQSIWCPLSAKCCRIARFIALITPFGWETRRCSAMLLDSHFVLCPVYRAW